MVRIVEFVASWNGNTNKGSIVMRKADEEIETLKQLSTRRFTMYVTLLQSSSSIFFDPATKSLRTGVADVD